MKRPLLSVCIPTYNRCKYLKELIDSILSIDRDDIEVVVKDCASTDGTVEMLKSISDPRLSVYWNANDLPAFCNMVDSIFCAQGKYALFCLDRDLLFPEKLVQVIDILSKDDYSCVVMSQLQEKFLRKNTQKLFVYHQCTESLLMQADTHHPTGMIFNHELMQEHLDREDYFGHLKDIYTWDFLMRDLFRYEKSAFFDCGGWKEREQSFKRKHRAGTQKKGDLFWFDPKFWEQYTYSELKQLDSFNDILSEQERPKVFAKIIAKNSDNIIALKSCMTSPNETAHYGIEMRFVSTVEIVRCYFNYRNNIARSLQNRQCDMTILKESRKCFFVGLVKLVIRSIKIDLGILNRIVFQHEKWKN